MDIENVVHDIEETIQLLTMTDCETNLKAINTLEEASYKLWVDSNTAFLDETFISTCTEEESWFWDDENLFDTKQEEDIWSLDGSSCIQDLSSSICTTFSGCDDSFCSRGYHGDAESSDTCKAESTDSESECSSLRRQKSKRSRLKHKRSSKKTNSSDQNQQSAINISSTRENTLGDDWVIVEESDRKCDKIVLPVSNDVSLHKEVVPTRDFEKESDSVMEDEEDWTILSLKITEVSSVTIRRRDSIFNLSRDSGITSPELKSLWNKRSAFKTQTRYKTCARTTAVPEMVQELCYQSWINPSPH